MILAADHLHCLFHGYFRFLECVGRENSSVEGAAHWVLSQATRGLGDISTTIQTFEVIISIFTEHRHVNYGHCVT